MDANTSPAVLQWQAGLWLGVRLDFIGALITFFVVAVAIVSDQYLSSVTGDDFISAGYLALGLTYSFTLTIALKYAVRVLAQGQGASIHLVHMQAVCDSFPVCAQWRPI